MATPTQLLEPWLDHLDRRLVEREVASRLALLGVLGRVHVLLLGPPGTAKSMLAREVSASVGGRVFSTLLTRFSVPEDLFGPLSLPALEEGRYERLVDGYLPTADVAFVDEIYKANASILNALLEILNERRYTCGNRSEAVPLRCLFAASNEIPDDDAGLDALDDRLLLRIEVEPIESPHAFVAMVRSGLGAETPAVAPEPISLAALRALEEAAGRVRLGDEVALRLVSIRRDARAADLRISDRRYKQAVRLMAVMAATEGRSEIRARDLGVLRYVLWQRPEEQPAVRRLVGSVLEDLGGAPPVGPDLAALSDMLEDLEARADRTFSQPHAYFSAEGKGTMQEILHKTLELARHGEAWIRERSRSLDGLGGLWTCFWHDAAAGGGLRDRILDLLQHDLFRRILPNVDGALARKWREEGGDLLQALAPGPRGDLPNP